jgi:hypothetical protein
MEGVFRGTLPAKRIAPAPVLQGRPARREPGETITALRACISCNGPCGESWRGPFVARALQSAIRTGPSFAGVKFKARTQGRWAVCSEAPAGDRVAPELTELSLSRYASNPHRLTSEEFVFGRTIPICGKRLFFEMIWFLSATLKPNDTGKELPEGREHLVDIDENHGPSRMFV